MTGSDTDPFTVGGVKQYYFTRTEALNLSEYINLPREVRQGHIDLTTPCQTENGKRGGRAKRGRKALLAVLGVENDVPNWVEARIQLCHACDCHSGNGWCENPLHFSIGTTSENQSDAPLEVRQENGRKIGQRAAELGTGIHDPAVREETRLNRCKTVQVTHLESGGTVTFKSVKLAAWALGLDPGALSNVSNGKHKQHKGYTARYL